MNSERRTTNPWALWALMAALVVGAALRLIWPFDIEYKFDEQWMFERTQRVGADEAMPLHGMPTSAQFLNPGLNVWLFVGLGKAFGVDSPPELARIVQFLSVAGLVLLVWFACRYVPAEQRELWLWAAAFMALNPFAVIYHRKIWQPCLFPVFTMVFLIAWWRRRERGGAFLWGLTGALLGQVQMAGFFFAGGFFLWTLLIDRRGVRWRSWLVGSVLGALPLVPWLAYMLTRPGGESIAHSSVANIWSGYFWWHWFTQPLGFTIHYVFGRDFIDFLRHPLIAGRPTYLVGALHAALALLTLWVVARAFGYLWGERQRWRDLMLGKFDGTHLAVAAGIWGYGLLMTLSSMKVHRHYLLVAMPLVYVWLAWMVLGRRECEAVEVRQAGHVDFASSMRWPGRLIARLGAGRVCLLLLCVVQGLLSLSMLGYIHVNQRYINGDFRMPYGAQMHVTGQRAEGTR